MRIIKGSKLFQVLFILPVLLAMSCVPLDTGSYSGDKTLRYEDATYEDEVRTVRMYPLRNTATDVAQAPVVPIQQANSLLLEFDMLYTDFEELNARIIHCDANWKPSQFPEMEYLFDFNEFPVNQYDVSISTRVPYTYYQFRIPRLKISGNYLIVVYRGTNKNDILLSRRFMVFEDLAQVGLQIGLSSGVNERRTHQQLDFTISYTGLEVLDPLNQIKVVLRQNQRTDTEIHRLQPSNVRENDKILEYRHFNLENNFPGWNEFRFFDLRMINAMGMNVDRMARDEKTVRAFLTKDRSREGLAYGQYNDINGQYVINNIEGTGNRLEADYLETFFRLDMPEPLPNAEVYIMGQMVDWQLSDKNRMFYDEESKSYLGRLLLKQGFYNFCYVVKSRELPPYHLEGSHFETENMYEVFVYFRPLGGRGDLLVGYHVNNYNFRRF